jgi:hypothetical protein
MYLINLRILGAERPMKALNEISGSNSSGLEGEV